MLGRRCASSVDLGGLLESTRLSEEISQAVSAKKLGISGSHLCDIEKGRKFVSLERAARFAKILGRSQQQFIRQALQELVDEVGLKSKVDIADT